MKNRSFLYAAGVLSLVVSLSGIGAGAQSRPGSHFSGLINDYSPSNVKGGPWEMHGTWSLDLQGEFETADFTAAMTMSDYVVSSGVVDTSQAGQNAHTHHIRLTQARITRNMTGCPTFSPPTEQGFQLSGTVSLITGNGGPAPFETTPPSSTLQICVTGGVDVTYSNITLVFGGPATSHFGTQAIHGVVRKVQLGDD